MINREKAETIAKGLENGRVKNPILLLDVTKEFRSKTVTATLGIIYWIEQLVGEDDGFELKEKGLALFEVLNKLPFAERTDVDRFQSIYMAVLLSGVENVSSLPEDGSLEKIILSDSPEVVIDSGVMRLPQNVLKTNAVVWKHDEEGFFGMRYTREAEDSLPLMIANSQPLMEFLNQR